MSELGDFFAETALPQLFDGLGEDVVHWPRGRESAAETIRAIVDRTNQTAEGADINGPARKEIEAFLTLSVAKSVVITVNEKGTDVSRIVVDGFVWFAEKLLGEDEAAAGFKHYQFTRKIGVATARSGR